jgi:hypothetical protein
MTPNKCDKSHPPLMGMKGHAALIAGIAKGSVTLTHLCEIAKDRCLPDLPDTARGLRHPRDEVQKGGLAGAVAPDNAQSLP